ncbi:PREDICTED: uncharacterized protein LOC109126311 [Camelina sativa]|uniref:Uncharacterized protein LOC109126311 n=1 Tax=Camelina sativa TaxID=90675 RepID=A0ABM1QEY2_CAMSA|nr:PREDICTED: uncharacterized protein LOC109126311 [Camelina sativa]
MAQALRDPNFRKAMSEEIDAQMRHHTWDLEKPPPSKQVIPSKWIFTLKYNPDGSIARYKARLVARGFNQQYGVDYAETFSPVIKSTTVRLVLEVAVKKNWSIHQVDINNAFLQDDIIIAGPPSLVQPFNVSIAAHFSLKDLGPLSYFLGIEATRSRQGLHLMQRKYVTELLARTNMFGVKPVATPMAQSPKLTLHSGTPLVDATHYRKVVGSLQYLSFTRPDIAFAINRLSQYMHQPTTDHWQAIKRVIRYLVGTTTHGIFLRSDCPHTIHAYSDTDWGGDVGDCLSTNGYIVYLGGSPISWSSKKQRSVARSSTEAEYRAIANAASKLQWICSLLSEMGVMLPVAPVVYSDNMGATYLCANPVFHSRMKHIALDYHFVRGHIQSGALRVSHISTHD